jgi:lipopolysaccharide/colanic/teichoic acid biosynthesis glycosyltransferase
MAKRLFDLIVATIALVVSAPLLAVAALGIWIASPGPLIYRARRVGLRGRPFSMYKLRTMHVEQGATKSRITLAQDPRIFGFGAFLRRSKIDEIPQLVNVLKGEMSIVGPRPEDVQIAGNHYTEEHLETLTVRPGLTSPGGLYPYMFADIAETKGDDPEGHYVTHVLPIKLALDLVYVKRASLRYDIRILVRTLGIVVARLFGKRRFADPPERAEAERYVYRSTESSATENMSPGAQRLYALRALPAYARGGDPS